MTDEVLLKYQAAMGDDLGAGFRRLWNDCVWLHMKWAAYTTVFEPNPQRAKLLNSASPWFFRITHDTLVETVLLTISRFTDPLEVKGRETLSLFYLASVIAIERVANRKPPTGIEHFDNVALSSRVKALEQQCGFAREYRHRLLAHRDRALALNLPDAEPLEQPRREQTQAAIDAITALLNDVDSHYCNGETTWFDRDSDGTGLLRVIRDGIEARDAALERMRTGAGDATFFTRPLP
jgi:hypothetical protein